MKFVNIILSILFLMFSCMPCADREENSAAHAEIEFKSNSENHSHDKRIDLCTPFCVCNCCGALVLAYFQINTINFTTLITIIKIVLPTYQSILSSNFFGSIWQPPQIA